MDSYDIFDQITKLDQQEGNLAYMIDEISGTIAELNKQKKSLRRMMGDVQMQIHILRSLMNGSLPHHDIELDTFGAKLNNGMQPWQV